MKTTTVLALLIALSLIGVADSWYLAESAATDTPLICGPGMLEGCNAVAQSPYSKLFGIPLGVYGVLFYSLVLIVSAAMLFFKQQALSFYLLIITFVGGVASVVFLFIQFFLIQALCIYCLISAGVSFALFGLSYVLFSRRSVSASSDPVSVTP